MALHSSILTYFETRMREHDCVRSIERLEHELEHIYYIHRNNGLPPVRVLLSDAYSFGLADFLAKPSEIRHGDFILIARPEAGFDGSILSRTKKAGIGIGGIGGLMGALNFKCPADYKKLYPS